MGDVGSDIHGWNLDFSIIWLSVATNSQPGFNFSRNRGFGGFYAFPKWRSADASRAHRALKFEVEMTKAFKSRLFIE
ncbi:unnamed protein product [Boreogadus saida]